MATDSQGLDGFSWFGLAVFLCVGKWNVPCQDTSRLLTPRTVALVIFPIKVPLPFAVSRLLYKTFVALRICDYSDEPQGRWHVWLSLETAPFIGVLLLLATTTIDGSVIGHGIAGENGIRPYNVLALFIILVRRYLFICLGH
jgi:hypothetical protein